MDREGNRGRPDDKRLDDYGLGDLRQRHLSTRTAARLGAGRPALILLAAGLLAAAGCGGSSNGSSSASGPRLTKQQLIKRADAICIRWNTRNTALQRQTPEIGNPFDKRITSEQRAKLADVVHRYAANVRSEGHALERLRPPADVEDEWRATLNKVQKFADAADGVGDALANGDAEAYASDLRRLQDNSLATDTFVSRYGFAVCGAHS